jgi:glycosyltransferase involved in cell wall biosynthesis
MKIYWYAPDKIFEIFSNRDDNPSFRLRCKVIHDKLLKDKIDSNIISNIEDFPDFYGIDYNSILVLLSFGEQEYHLAKKFVDNGGSVIHDYSENIRGIPILEETKKLCKYIVCCSSYLENLEREDYGNRVTSIKDPIEEFPYNITNNIDYREDKLKVVWCGMGGNAYLMDEVLKSIIDSKGMEYVEISNRAESTYQWNLNTYRENMAKCDIALCPQDHWSFPAKSNVKVTAAMSLGLPVIASPLTSYEEIIVNGYNGFIAHSLEDWGNYLNRLKDKYLRELIIKRGFESIKSYKLENIYQQWLTLFRNCL